VKHIGCVPSRALSEFKKFVLENDGLSFVGIYGNTEQKLKEKRKQENSLAALLMTEEV
jgi:hypothetical protein